MGHVVADRGECFYAISQGGDGFVDDDCFFEVLLTANFVVIRSLCAGQINQGEFLAVNTVTEEIVDAKSQNSLTEAIRIK